jgi:hypothetical protein
MLLPDDLLKQLFTDYNSFSHTASKSQEKETVWQSSTMLGISKTVPKTYLHYYFAIVSPLRTRLRLYPFGKHCTVSYCLLCCLWWPANPTSRNFLLESIEGFIEG